MKERGSRVDRNCVIKNDVLLKASYEEQGHEHQHLAE